MGVINTAGLGWAGLGWAQANIVISPPESDGRCTHASGVRQHNVLKEGVYSTYRLLSTTKALLNGFLAKILNNSPSENIFAKKCPDFC